MRRMFVSLTLCVLIAGCTSSQNGGSTSSTSPNPFKAAMVTDVGGLGDKSFNDSAARGLQMAHDRLNVSTSVLQSRSATDYAPNLAALAQQGNKLIFAIGYLMHDSVNDVAPRFPNQHFAIVDSVVDQPNVASLTFKEEEGSFLAGVLAGLISKKHSVGFLGGMDSPLIKKFESGFRAGVASANPRTEVKVKYAGSFDDVAAGREFASVMYDQGADIIYAAAGKDGLGAIDEAKSRTGVFVIGVDSDQDALAPGKVLTSVLKHVDTAVYKLISDDVHGKFVAGHLVFGLKDDGVGLTEMRYSASALPRNAKQILNAYRKLIVDGKLVVPSTEAQMKAFKPIALVPPSPAATP